MLTIATSERLGQHRLPLIVNATDRVCPPKLSLYHRLPANIFSRRHHLYKTEVSTGGGRQWTRRKPRKTMSVATPYPRSQEKSEPRNKGAGCDLVRTPWKPG